MAIYFFIFGFDSFLFNKVENGVMAFHKQHSFVFFLMKYMAFAFKPEE